MYADVAIGIGQNYGVLAQHNYSLSQNHPAFPATANDLELFDVWDNTLANSLEIGTDDDYRTQESASANMLQDTLPPLSSSVTEPTVSQLVPVPSPQTQRSTVLNEKQNMVLDIVASHVHSHVKGLTPPQCLLVVHGQGGTGKTAVLNAIADTFEDFGVSALLAKTAMSGVAASIVRGCTLHSWAGLPVKLPPTNKWVTHPSKEMARRRKTNMSSILWLTVDEMSMLTALQLSWLSQVTSILCTGIFSVKPSVPFGGVSVILLGDMHQFPPIANMNKELYNSSPSDYTSSLGRTLFEQFDTVIRLEEQMRIHDPVWEDILTRTHTGDCNSDDLAAIDRLVLGHDDCVTPDFLSPPWNDCVLVTSQNAVQMLWNEQMLKAHCTQTGYTRYIIHASDFARNGELTTADRLAIAQLKLDQTNRLPHKIEIAVGMKIMVLTNVVPSAGVANGSRGSITDIILDPRETFDASPVQYRRLLYPPSVILFAPLYPSHACFQNLPPGVVPLFPLTKTFKMKSGRSIQQTQYSLTPAYAFTDYKSQGQMLQSDCMYDMIGSAIACDLSASR